MSVYSGVLTSVEFANDVYKYWQPRILQYISKPSEKQLLSSQLERAQSYEEWHDIALRLDHLMGNDLWRTDPASSDYDYKLIALLVFKLDQLTSRAQIEALTEVVRSGLVRNMGSIADSELYTRAYAGTKTLIEDYIHSVCDSLEYLGSIAFDKPAEYRAELRTFFRDTKQSYGCTALVLHGGSVFGLCHLGVIKSLLDRQLLPSVICGATVGSIIAAYVCSIPHNEIGHSIDHIGSLISPFSDVSNPEGELGTLTENFARTLFSKEVLMFFEYVSDNLGDLTFEEAYLQSGRVLNILVLREGESGGSFFNYLRTPKIVVRSAVLASIGSNVLPGHHCVDLLVKNHEGKVCKFSEEPVKFYPANHKTYVPTRESPYTRLAELFNVNNYVVSVSRPYFAPLLLSEFKYRGQPRLWRKVLTLIRMSAQYRIGQLAEWGWLSPQLKSILIDEMIPGGSQVNIVPETDAIVRDLLLVFDQTNISQKVSHWISLGEKSVWPQMPLIWARSKIEYVLEELYEELK